MQLFQQMTMYSKEYLEDLKSIQKHHTEWKIREKDYQKTIMKYIMDSKWMQESAIEEGKKKSMKQGLEQGILKAKTDMIKKMLNKKIPIEEISEITELTIEQIEKIK